MKRALEALRRLRAMQRDRSTLEHAQAREATRTARAATDLHTRRREAGAEALRRAGAEGRPGPWWVGAAKGALRLADRVGEVRDRETTLEEAEARAATERQQSERALRLIERVNERLAQAERKRAARVAQRKIDELSHRRRSHALVAIGFLAIGLPGTLRAAEPTADPALAPLLSELRAKRDELQRREQELVDRERHAGELEAAAEARLAEAQTLVARVEQRLAEFEAQHGDKSISRLARIYAEMPPRTAASLINQLELDLATSVVGKMKPDQSSQLLALLPPERALVLSRRVARPLALEEAEPR